MTQTETTLLILAWIFYGMYAVKQTDGFEGELKGDVTIVQFFIVIGAPLVFIGRALIGIFKKYKA